METRVRSLGQEAPLEEEMVIRSNTLAWRIPWTEEPMIPSAQRLVWAAKQALGNAALGALFA